MTKSNRVNTNNKSDEPNSTGSPLKKAGRKTLGNVLQYSPKRGVTKVNKVFVTGTQFGIILLRTEKQNSPITNSRQSRSANFTLSFSVVCIH